MLSQGFSSEPTAAESAVLDEISGVLVGHLEYWRGLRERGEQWASSPVLIHVDGPGRTLFLDKIAGLLDPEACGRPGDRPPDNGRWTVIRFDAWQYQRVAPPWWWLIKTIDRQVRGRVRRYEGWWPVWRWRLADYRWRTGQLLRDVAVVAPPVLVAAVIAWGAWMISGEERIADILQWATTVIAALTALVGFTWSAANAVRRHLLVESPAGAKAVLQTSDPMADLMRRYAFLIRAAGTPVAVLIDNLDRCRGDYVVELLEGIQTLFREEAPGDDLPMVLYVAAADRGWLCDSYVKVYEEFKESVGQPGRPFGLAFLDKIFNLSLRIPTVSAATSLSADLAEQDQSAGWAAIPGAKRIRGAEREIEIRRELRAFEAEADSPGLDGPGRPDPRLRRLAVRRLAELEHESSSKACEDTEHELKELVALAEPGPTIVRHLAAAYCVQRTVLLLAGHEFDDDDDAIRRLGLWTILTLRWPLLADHLERCPADLLALHEGAAPKGVDDQIARLFSLTEAKRFAQLAEATQLDDHAIRRFTIPIDVSASRTSAGVMTS